MSVFLRMVVFLKPRSPAVSSEAESLHEVGPSFFIIIIIIWSSYYGLVLYKGNLYKEEMLFWYKLFELYMDQAPN